MVGTRSKVSRKGQGRGRDPRVLIGASVAAAILVVVGIKLLGARSVETRSARESFVMASPTGEASSAAVPVEEPLRSDPSAIPPPPTEVRATPDPFPTDPASQVQWIIRKKKPAMILFHSTNCIPCKAMEKLVNEVRGDYEPDIVFVDVITNDRANSQLVRQAGIRGIPTSFFVTRSGQAKGFMGAMKVGALRAELASLLESE